MEQVGSNSDPHGIIDSAPDQTLEPAFVYRYSQSWSLHSFFRGVEIEFIRDGI